MSMLSDLLRSYRELDATFDGDPVVGILRREGFSQLAGRYGCGCMALEVHRTRITATCQEHGPRKLIIRRSRSFDHPAGDLDAVVKLVLANLGNLMGDGPMASVEAEVVDD